jgi:5,10-methenyltetrahydromethanopterin hydrogenase
MSENLQDEMKNRADDLVKEYAPAKVEEEKSPQLPIFKYDENKTIDQNANDLVELMASKEASEDKEFVDTIAETKKETIKESAKINKDIHIIKKSAEKVVAITEKDRAFYEQWNLILGWGGIKAPVTKPLAVFLLFLILPFYTLVTICVTLPVSILKTLFGAINSLLEEIKTFGKIARSIAFTILVLATIALVVYIVLFNLDKYNIIDISNFLKNIEN